MARKLSPSSVVALLAKNGKLIPQLGASQSARLQQAEDVLSLLLPQDLLRTIAEYNCDPLDEVEFAVMNYIKKTMAILATPGHGDLVSRHVGAIAPEGKSNEGNDIWSDVQEHLLWNSDLFAVERSILDDLQSIRSSPSASIASLFKHDRQSVHIDFAIWKAFRHELAAVASSKIMTAVSRDAALEAIDFLMRVEPGGDRVAWAFQRMRGLAVVGWIGKIAAGTPQPLVLDDLIPERNVPIAQLAPLREFLMKIDKTFGKDSKNSWQIGHDCEMLSQEDDGYASYAAGVSPFAIPFKPEEGLPMPISVAAGVIEGASGVYASSLSSSSSSSSDPSGPPPSS